MLGCSVVRVYAHVRPYLISLLKGYAPLSSVGWYGPAPVPFDLVAFPVLGLQLGATAAATLSAKQYSHYGLSLAPALQPHVRCAVHSVLASLIMPHSSRPLPSRFVEDTHGLLSGLALQRLPLLRWSTDGAVPVHVFPLEVLLGRLSKAPGGHVRASIAAGGAWQHVATAVCAVMPCGFCAVAAAPSCSGCPRGPLAAERSSYP